jgi:hypothetical protein
MLTIPTGVLAIFSLAFTMLLCIWLIEDLEQHAVREEQEPYECELARTLDALRMGRLG